MPTYRLDLAYDGAGFHGFAKQPGLRTVQGELEAVLEPWIKGASTAVAGRTDKGVHASHQVVSVSCDPLDTERVIRSLNRQLAPAIAVRRITRVPDGFHARFSATGRAYRYRIRNSAIPDPFTARTRWAYTEPLDVAAMDAAAHLLVGEHDFAAFCRARAGAPTTRRVLWSSWRRKDVDVDLSIGASSFCHQMVRSIVAVSVEIGRGRLPSGAMEEILTSGDRSIAKGAAPPGGLTLVAVSYGVEPLPRPRWVSETS